MGRRHNLSRSTADPVKIKRSRCSEEQMIAISKKQEGDGEGGEEEGDTAVEDEDAAVSSECRVAEVTGGSMCGTYTCTDGPSPVALAAAAAAHTSANSEVKSSSYHIEK